MVDIINWISNWFLSQCDGDWEHENLIRIETTDNPGWAVTIDLTDTELDNLDIDVQILEISKDNWFLYKVKDKQFFGAGDLDKLHLILERFKELTLLKP
ncbi:immunity 53 family protein [Chitinophaga sp. 22536]|uniref:immunity 53 family protein n=1 Tax=unclassified Chitinophaga TaxID=2619133 RepID=UPI003F865F25